MKQPQEYRDLVKKLRGETECYPDECEYCSAEGKCRCQRLGQACDAIEELIAELTERTLEMEPGYLYGIGRDGKLYRAEVKPKEGKSITLPKFDIKQ